jgi:hypothetical protein
VGVFGSVATSFTPIDLEVKTLVNVEPVWRYRPRVGNGCVVLPLESAQPCDVWQTPRSALPMPTSRRP